VNGTVFADGNGTVVSFPDVALQNRDGFFQRAFSESDGRYAVSNLPPGTFTVTAYDFNTGRTGIATGVVSPGGTSTVNVTVGNATSFEPHVLDGSATGFRYDIGCEGAVGNGGQPALGQMAFQGGAILTLAAGPTSTGASTLFGCLYSGRLELNNRGVVLEGGRYDVVGVETTRKIFVPEGGEFGRYLEMLTNRTSVDLTVRVRINGRLAMQDADTRLTVKPSDNSNTAAVFEDASGEHSSVGFVFGSQGAPVAALPTGIAALARNHKYEWVVTIPAGQTRSILHYVVQATTAGAAAAESIALANLSEPNALAGLTAAEKASIVNFVIP
jgi:hypothetical protein